MKLLLKVSYRGENYAGYQFQPGVKTVQGTLTEAFSACLGFPVSVTGCSRTDAGVHALGFVCAVEPREEERKAGKWLSIPVGKFHRAARRYLPGDISIVGEGTAGDDFHPRYSVKSKTYVYRMYDSPAWDPFEEKRAWHLGRKIDGAGIEKMNECARELAGRHDFTSFMTAGSKIVDAAREVYSVSVKREGGVILLKITADGFLYNMVRIIAGTLVDCAGGLYSPGDLTKVLEARDRTKAGRTAPPDGLYLMEADYDPAIRWIIE